MIKTPAILQRTTFQVLLCIVATLFASCLVHAQEGIVFSHLTMSQGLSQGTVVCIFQDRQGFMWFGTQEGLNRFDGYDFTVFKHSPTDSTTLNESFVITLAEDSSGTLFAGSRGIPDLLNRFDRGTERFSQVPRDSVDLRHAHIGSAFQYYQDPSGVRWAGSMGKGVTRFDPRTGTTTTYKHDPSDPGSLIDDRVYSVVGDRTGIIWMGTHEGLERFDPRTGKFVHYLHDEKNPNSLSDNWVWPILEDRRGILWFGTFRGGLNRFDRATGTFTHFRNSATDPRSLGDDRCYSLFQDRSGMIWVGTSNGVDLFNPEGAFRYCINDPKDPGSLVNNAVFPICVDRTGATWIGTASGLDRWDRSKGKFTHFRHDPANPSSLGDDVVQSILEDRSGILWFGTNNSGLDRYDPATGRFTHFRHDPSNPRSLSSNRIFALLEDHKGDLWIGTYEGGLNRLDRNTGDFTAYTHNDSVPGSLSAPGVWALHEDRDGVLWVGSYNGGLNRFNPETETFTHFKEDPSNSQGLSNSSILCIHEDRKGYLWLATMNGLNRFDKETKTFRRYFEKDGLPNSYIVGILEDDRGNLWMSTVKGISRFNPQNESFRNFDKSDGLQGDDFNQGAFARDNRTGELFFGGNNGFNVFHPDSVRENAFVPPVVFSSFARYNTDDKEGRALNVPGIAARQAITLSYKDNITNIEFAALSYYNTAKNEYAYKLEGFSDNWIQLGTERRATFTNLDAGEYTLRVKGSNSSGLWNNEGTTLHLTVTPPWWKTRWAYGTYIVLAFAFLYGIRAAEIKRREQKTQIRESQLRAKAVEAEKRALQAENERKTKELEDARRLQLSMLPREVPKIPHYDISVFMKTATEVGGDYYDFSVAEDGTLNIAFGDATGHGMQAGTIVTLMKGLFLSDATRFEVQAFLSHCSRAIKEIKLGRLFMAFTLVRLRGRQVAFSTAGMPPVFLYRSADGSVEEILLKGMPLGAMRNFPYAVHTTELCRGDMLVLLTDGLPEQKNSSGQMFDYDRVRSLLAASGALPPEKIIECLVHEGESWMAGIPQDDDITIMAIKIKE